MPKAANACVSLRNWHSLRHRAEFLNLQQKGQKWITPAFVIQTFPRPDSDLLPEIGFTATKKLGNAVIRNRAKRRLRAACDAVITDFAAPGYQFVLIARSEVLNREFPILLKDLRWALRKLEIPAAGSHDKAA